MFIALLGISAILIAAIAAFFSIYGLAAIFSGIFWPVIVMGSFLEVGKLVAASYLYRYKNNIPKLLKRYLLTSVIVLMVITSVGIFGFLSMGYQQNIMGHKEKEQKILLLTEEKQELEKLKEERLQRKKQIDKDIASLPNNYITGRQRLMKSYGPELKKLDIDIEKYTKEIREKTAEIAKLKQEKLVNEVHVGPIIFIAKALDTDTNDAILIMIILIMFSFDPLAVALTIAFNHALEQKQKNTQNQNFYVNKKTDIKEKIIEEDTAIKENQVAKENCEEPDRNFKIPAHRKT